MSNLTMTMSNRLLQNYLDLSLPSKKSLKLEAYKNEEETPSKKKEFNPKVEINRIPSDKPKIKYSVSSVATQVDMNQNSLIAERKDYMYRNQELSDVESQILSIEVLDFCNDATNNSTNDTSYNCTGSLTKTSNAKASIKINDLKAFKNSIRLVKEAENNQSREEESTITEAEISIKAPVENKLVFRFSKSINEDHLKFENDTQQITLSTTGSMSTMIQNDTALDSFFETKDLCYNNSNKIKTKSEVRLV